MPRVAHDVLVAHALAVGLGDEADAQRMGGEPLGALDLEPGHPASVRQYPAHRIGVQRCTPICPALLMLRNSGPALRLATSCQA